MSVAELQQAVANLSEAELKQFAAWFEEFMSDKWDRQIERDVASGKLDKRIGKADEDIGAGRGQPL